MLSATLVLTAALAAGELGQNGRPHGPSSFGAGWDWAMIRAEVSSTANAITGMDFSDHFYKHFCLAGTGGADEPACTVGWYGAQPAVIDPAMTTVTANMATLNLQASCTAQESQSLADLFTAANDGSTDTNSQCGCQYDGFSTALIQSKTVNFGIGQHFEARLNTDGMADKTVASVWFQSDDVEISIAHEENKLTVSAYVFGADSTLSSHAQVITVAAGGTHTYGVQWQVNNDLVFVFDDDIKATMTAAQWFPTGEDGDNVVRDMLRLMIDVQISDDATEADLTAMESACVADPITVSGLQVLEAANWEVKCGQSTGFYNHKLTDSAYSMLAAKDDKLGTSYADIGNPVGFYEPNNKFAEGVSPYVDMCEDCEGAACNPNSGPVSPALAMAKFTVAEACAATDREHCGGPLDAIAFDAAGVTGEEFGGHGSNGHCWWDFTVYETPNLATQARSGPMQVGECRPYPSKEIRNAIATATITTCGPHNTAVKRTKDASGVMTTALKPGKVSQDATQGYGMWCKRQLQWETTKDTLVSKPTSKLAYPNHLPEAKDDDEMGELGSMPKFGGECVLRTRINDLFSDPMNQICNNAISAWPNRGEGAPDANKIQPLSAKVLELNAANAAGDRTYEHPITAYDPVSKLYYGTRRASGLDHCEKIGMFGNFVKKNGIDFFKSQIHPCKSMNENSVAHLGCRIVTWNDGAEGYTAPYMPHHPTSEYATRSKLCVSVPAHALMWNDRTKKTGGMTKTIAGYKNVDDYPSGFDWFNPYAQAQKGNKFWPDPIKNGNEQAYDWPAPKLVYRKDTLNKKGKEQICDERCNDGVDTCSLQNVPNNKCKNNKMAQSEPAGMLVDSGGNMVPNGDAYPIIGGAVGAGKNPGDCKFTRSIAILIPGVAFSSLNSNDKTATADAVALTVALTLRPVPACSGTHQAKCDGGNAKSCTKCEKEETAHIKQEVKKIDSVVLTEQTVRVRSRRAAGDTMATVTFDNDWSVFEAKAQTLLNQQVNVLDAATMTFDVTVSGTVNVVTVTSAVEPTLTPGVCTSHSIPKGTKLCKDVHKVEVGNEVMGGLDQKNTVTSKASIKCRGVWIYQANNPIWTKESERLTNDGATRIDILAGMYQTKGLQGRPDWKKASENPICDLLGGVHKCGVIAGGTGATPKLQWAKSGRCYLKDEYDAFYTQIMAKSACTTVSAYVKGELKNTCKKAGAVEAMTEFVAQTAECPWRHWNSQSYVYEHNTKVNNQGKALMVKAVVTEDQDACYGSPGACTGRVLKISEEKSNIWAGYTDFLAVGNSTTWNPMLVEYEVGDDVERAPWENSANMPTMA